MKLKILMFSALLVACTSTAPEEGKPVPEKLRAKALDFETKKRYCAKVAKTEDQYADCVGVKWEILKHDQTGLHEHRNAKGELHAD